MFVTDANGRSPQPREVRLGRGSARRQLAASGGTSLVGGVIVGLVVAVGVWLSFRGSDRTAFVVMRWTGLGIGLAMVVLCLLLIALLVRPGAACVLDATGIRVGGGSAPRTVPWSAVAKVSLHTPPGGTGGPTLLAAWLDPASDVKHVARTVRAGQAPLWLGDLAGASLPPDAARAALDAWAGDRVANT